MRHILTEGKRTKEIADKLSKESELSFDTEANSTRSKGVNENFKCVSVIISTRDDSYYIPLNHTFYSKNMRVSYFKKYFSKLFTDKNIMLIGQGINFDFHVLERLGIIPQRENYFDTLLAARMINEEYSNSLEHILEKYLGVTGLHTFDDVVATVTKERKEKAGMKSNNKATFDLVEINKAAVYGTEDAEYLFDLKDLLVKELKEKELYDIYTELIVPKFSNVFYNMENKGVMINKEEINNIDREITIDVNRLQKEMEDIVGFDINANSPKQLSELLYNEYTSDSPCDICKDKCSEKDCESYKLWKEYGHKKPNIDIREKSFNFPIPERTKTGQPSSGKDSLKRFKHYTPKNEWQEKGIEFIDTLLEFKKLSKLKSTFVDGLRDQIYDDGRVHPSFNVMAAKSGRASSSEPNGQNLSTSKEEDKYKIRKMFIPDKGKVMVAFDYDNLEMKLLTHYSKDKHLIETFEKGLDSHGATAVNVLDLDCHPNEAKELYPTERSIGKTLNFAQHY